MRSLSIGTVLIAAIFASPAFANWWIVRSSDGTCLVVDIEPTGKDQSVTKVGKDAYQTAEQAEADVKAAQATGLQQQAAAHRSEAATSRDHLNEQWGRAEKLDPATPTDKTPRSTHKEPQTL